MNYEEKYKEVVEQLKAQVNLNYAINKTNDEVVMLNKILIQREIDKIDNKLTKE
jgi:hypothetical protein